VFKGWRLLAAVSCANARICKCGACVKPGLPTEPPPCQPKPTLEVDVRVVEQHHLELAPVVLVHDAGAGVDEVLDGQAGAGGDAAVGAGGDGDAQPGAHAELAARRDGALLGAVGGWCGCVKKA